MSRRGHRSSYGAGGRGTRRICLMADLDGPTQHGPACSRFPKSLGVLPEMRQVRPRRGRRIHHVESSALGGRWCTLRQHRKASAARAWWLVEAESADAARKVIAGSLLDAGDESRDGEREAVYGLGRILASGGAT